MKPRIFISAASVEFKRARNDVARVLEFLGFESERQDIFGTESGDLRQVLRDKIDGCEGLIHIVGRSYGAEPSVPDPELGRVSYAQFEFLHAKKKGLKIWLLVAEPSYVGDAAADALDLPPDGDHPDRAGYHKERSALQAAYLRARVNDGHVWYRFGNSTELENAILKLRDDSKELRDRFAEWQTAVQRGQESIIERQRWSLATTTALVGAAAILSGAGVWLAYRTGAKVATGGDVAAVDARIASLNASVAELRTLVAGKLQPVTERTLAKAGPFVAGRSEQPPADLLVENDELKRQLAEAHRLIRRLAADGGSPPADVVAAVRGAETASNLVSMGAAMSGIPASIALTLLNGKAASEVSTLLGSQALDDPAVVTWSTAIRMSRPETRSWYFVSIPVDAEAYDAARDCKDGGCIIAAADAQVAALVDRSAPQERRRESLKMLVGLMSELHRPLHCATRMNDRGGNALRVRLKGRLTNLHAIWDVDILRARLRQTDVGQYVKTLLGTMTQESRQRLAAGTVKDWAWETHRIAKDVIYPEIPPAGGIELGDDYLGRHADVIDRQLQRAGVRLADLLNNTIGR